MANVKFTEFPSAATVGATDIIPIVQGGVNKKATALIFSDYIGSAFVGLTGNQTIAGVKTFSSQLISTVAIGTAPFSVISTTKVTNLNADLLDGLSSAAFQTVLTNPITGTGTTNYLPKFTGASALGNSTIFDNGNVGIGTSSPALPLHLYNSAAALAYFESTNANGAYVIWRNSGTSIGDVGSALGISGSNSASDFMVASRSGNMILGSSSAERMRITSAGNVAIGTASPFGGAKLQIKTSTDINIAFQNGTLDATGVKINAYNDAASLNIPMELNGSILYFKTGETERMRIKSSGVINISNIPTSPAGLSAGDIYSNLGILTIV